MRTTHRLCTDCHFPYPESAYEYTNAEKKWRRKVCQKCRGIKQKYGISGERFYEMLDEQLHSCLICERSISDKKAVIDHDHKTGKVRALLCNQCNTGIGLLRHDPDIATRAAEFLRFHL